MSNSHTAVIGEEFPGPCPQLTNSLLDWLVYYVLRSEFISADNIEVFSLLHVSSHYILLRLGIDVFLSLELVVLHFELIRNKILAHCLLTSYLLNIIISPIFSTYGASSTFLENIKMWHYFLFLPICVSMLRVLSIIFIFVI